MDEYILPTFHFDKSKTLLIIEPLDFTFRHYNLLENQICELPDPTKAKYCGRSFPVDRSVPDKRSTPHFVSIISLNTQKQEDHSGRLSYLILHIRARFIVLIDTMIS